VVDLRPVQLGVACGRLDPRAVDSFIALAVCEVCLKVDQFEAAFGIHANGRSRRRAGSDCEEQRLSMQLLSGLQGARPQGPSLVESPQQSASSRVELLVKHFALDDPIGS
jgi:hypothetical protein